MLVIKRAWLFLTIIAIPVCVILSIWKPVYDVYHYYGITIKDETIASLKDVSISGSLKSIEGLNLGEMGRDISNQDALKIANYLLIGDVRIKGLPRTGIELPFDRELVYAFKSNWQLSYCGFIIPSVYLKAYDITQDSRYLLAAKDFILGWYFFEAEQWLPKGFVWNDHAVSSRASILANFWDRYKSYAEFNSLDAKLILKLVSKTAKLLADDDFYTYKTNHGTMQSLALMKLSIYFPSIVGKYYEELSVSRLNRQIGYFINEEGVVTEHSADYHKFGMELFYSFIGMSKYSEFKVNESIKDKLLLSRHFMDAIYRSDGTLPAIGDTNVGKDYRGKVTFVTQNENNGFTNKELIHQFIFPKAGYLVWKTSDLEYFDKSHLAVSWSYYPYMGHKHADELGINIWRNGQNWLTGIGYWPYTSNLREEAIGWNGSNAPHLENESRFSKRESVIMSYGSSLGVRFAEFLRTEFSGFQVKRQVIQVGDSTWIIIDIFSDKKKNRKAKTVWTVDSSLSVIARNKKYRLLNRASGSEAIVFFQSSNKDSNMVLHPADSNSSLGWTASGQVLKKGHAFIYDVNSDDGWGFFCIDMKQKGASDGKCQISFEKQGIWSIELSDNLFLTRNRNNFKLQSGLDESHVEDFFLTKVSKKDQVDNANYTNFVHVKSPYGRKFKPLIKYRVRLTSILSVCLLFISFAFLVLKGWLIRLGALFYLSSFNCFVWAALGFYLQFVYFV